jgi:O-antigen/teichoic acid export membrane protein
MLRSSNGLRESVSRPLVGMTGWSPWFGRVLARALPRRGLARNVALVASGTILGQGVAAVAAPVLTRLFSPSDFGILGVYSSLLAILTGIVCFRYEFAIPLPEEDQDGAALVFLSIGIAFATSMVTLILVLLLRSSISGWTDTPSAARYLWLLPVGLLLAGIVQALTYWHIRKRMFAPVGRGNLVRGLGQASSQVSFGVAGAGPLGLLIGDAVGWAATDAVLTWSVRKKKTLQLPTITLDRITRVASRYRRFPLFAAGAGLINSMAQQTPLLLVAGSYGIAVAGRFGLAQRVVAVPTAFLGQAISQVYAGEVARLRRENPASLRPLWRRTARKLLLVGAVAAVGMVVAGPRLVSMLFGDEWRLAGVYAQLLSVSFLGQFVVAPIATLNIIERQDVQLVWDTIRLVLVVGSIVVSRAVGASSSEAVAVYALTSAVMYVTLGILAYRCLPGETPPAGTADGRGQG